MDVLIEDVSNSDEEEHLHVPNEVTRKSKPTSSRNLHPVGFPFQHRFKAEFWQNDAEMSAFAESVFIRRDFEEMDFTMERDSRTTFLSAFSPDGLTLATTHGDHDIRVFNVVTRKRLMTLSGHPRSPWTLNFHPVSNTLLASGCLSGQVRVWDIVNGGSEVFSVFPTSVITSVCFHPIEKCVAFATGNYIYLWDWSTNQVIARIETWSGRLNAHKAVMHVRFDPTGTRLLTAIANGIRGQVRAPLATTENEERDSRYEELLSSYENLRHSYRSLFNLSMSRQTNETNTRPSVLTALDEASRILFPPTRGSTGSGRQTTIPEYALPLRTYRSESPSSSENEDGRSSPSRPPRRPSFTYWTRSGMASRARSRGRYARQQPRSPSGQSEEDSRLPSILASLDSELDVMRRLTVFRRHMLNPYHSYRSLIDRLQQVRLMLIQIRHELQMVNESSETNDAASRFAQDGERSAYLHRLQMETQRARESTTSLTRAIRAVSDEIDNVFSADPLRPRTSYRRRGTYRRLPYRRERGRSPSDEELLALPPPPPPPGSPPPFRPLERSFNEVGFATQTEDAAVINVIPNLANDPQPSTSSGATEGQVANRSTDGADSNPAAVNVSGEEGPEAYLSTALRRLRELRSRETSDQTEGGASSAGSASALEDRLFAVIQCFLDCVSRVLRVYALQQTEDSAERRRGLVDLIHSLRSLILHFLQGEGISATQQEDNPLRRFIPRLDELAMEASRVLRSNQSSNVDTVGYALVQSAIDDLVNPTAAAAPSPSVTSGLANPATSPASTNPDRAEATAELRQRFDNLVDLLMANQRAARVLEATRSGNPETRAEGSQTLTEEQRGQTRPRTDDESLGSGQPEPRRPRLWSETNTSLREELNRPAVEQGVQRMWALEAANQTRRNELLRAQSGPDLGTIVDGVLNNLRNRERQSNATSNITDGNRDRVFNSFRSSILSTNTGNAEEGHGRGGRRLGRFLDELRNDTQFRGVRPLRERLQDLRDRNRAAEDARDSDSGIEEQGDGARNRPARWLSDLRDRIRAHTETNSDDLGERASLVSETRNVIMEHVRIRMEQNRLRGTASNDQIPVGRPSSEELRTADGSARAENVLDVADSAQQRQSTLQSLRSLVARRTPDVDTQNAGERSRGELPNVDHAFGLLDEALGPHARSQQRLRPGGMSSEGTPFVRSAPQSSGAGVRNTSDDIEMTNRDERRPLLAERRRFFNQNLLRAESASRSTVERGSGERNRLFDNILREHVRLRTQNEVSSVNPIEPGSTGEGGSAPDGSQRSDAMSQSRSSSLRGQAGESQPNRGRFSVEDRLGGRDWFARIQRLRVDADTSEGASTTRTRQQATDSSDNPQPADPRLAWPPRPLVRQNAVASNIDRPQIVEVPAREVLGQNYMQPSYPNYRIQCWDFSTSLPDLGNAQENVVVPVCRIHCDGWIDVSPRWDFLVAIYPKEPESFGANVGVYSLQKKTLGQILWTTSLSNSVVSVSLSPSTRYLLVGVTGTRLFGSYRGNKQTVAKVYHLDPNAKREKNNGNPGTPLSFVRDIERSLDVVSWSLNSIKWSPYTANGLVMCTNKGHVKVLY